MASVCPSPARRACSSAGCVCTLTRFLQFPLLAPVQFCSLLVCCGPEGSCSPPGSHLRLLPQMVPSSSQAHRLALPWWPHGEGGLAPEPMLCSFIPVGTPWSPSLWKLGRAAGRDRIRSLCFSALGKVRPTRSIAWWVRSRGEAVLSVTCGGDRKLGRFKVSACRGWS